MSDVSKRARNRQALHACNVCIWDLTESPLKSIPFNQIYYNKLQTVQVFPELLALQYLAPKQLQSIGRQGELQTLKKEKYVFTVSLRGLAPDGTQQRSQWIALEKLWGKHEALKKHKVWAVIFHFWVHWLCRTGTCPLRQEPHFLSSSMKLERPLLRQQRCLANEAWSHDNSRRIF